MQVRCPDCRESIDIEIADPSAGTHCAACGTVFNLVGEETIEHLPERPPQVGQFRLQERIGRGAFGTVWKAYDSTLDRVVAVKVPHRGELTLQQSEQFLREARASARLHHPNIVTVYEVGREQDTVYLVMDFVDGGTLSDQIADGPWTPREAAELCAKIAEAVDDAHAAGVIHRDLKPANVLLDSRSEPHITDFGLAKRITEDVTLSMDGKILGTPAYMSPEQAKGDTARIDVRTDVYSIGVMLFELLTGERPFRGSLQMLLRHVIESEPPRPRDLNRHVPRDLQTICLKCLEKEPRRRYATAGDLAKDLRRFLAGKPIQARPTPMLTRAQRWCSHNLIVVSLTIALLTALMLGLVATTMQWSRAERNAVREAELREQVQTLTRELLELADQLQNTQTAQAPKAPAPAPEDLVMGAPSAEPAPVGNGPRVPSHALRKSAAPVRLEAVTQSDVSPDTEPVEFDDSEAAELRAKAETKLQQLDRLAPEIAKQYRQLVNDSGRNRR
jgi:serine/threonine protein kinase